MGCSIVVIIAGVLFWYDLLNTSAFLTIAFCSLAWLYVGPGLYFKFGFLKFFYHDVLHWHIPDNSTHYFDGLSDHATCKYCGKDIMQDSQGNWFE